MQDTKGIPDMSRLMSKLGMDRSPPEEETTVHAKPDTTPTERLTYDNAHNYAQMSVMKQTDVQMKEMIALIRAMDTKMSMMASELIMVRSELADLKKIVTSADYMHKPMFDISQAPMEDNYIRPSVQHYQQPQMYIDPITRNHMYSDIPDNTTVTSGGSVVPGNTFKTRADLFTCLILSLANAIQDKVQRENRVMFPQSCSQMRTRLTSTIQAICRHRKDITLPEMKTNGMKLIQESFTGPGDKYIRTVTETTYSTMRDNPRTSDIFSKMSILISALKQVSELFCNPLCDILRGLDDMIVSSNGTIFMIDYSNITSRQYSPEEEIGQKVEHSEISNYVLNRLQNKRPMVAIDSVRYDRARSMAAKAEAHVTNADFKDLKTKVIRRKLFKPVVKTSNVIREG